MGIYDRDYYRREGPSFLESFSGQGRVCKYLIIANVIFLVLQIISPPGPNPNSLGVFTDLFELKVDKVLSGQVWRLLSYAFLHHYGVWTHIVFNMLFLWWFGHEVEDMYGPREFLCFYLVSAFLGGLAFTGWAYFNERSATCVGASGAVTAVMVLYAFHYPKRIIYIWFLIPVPIWLFVGFQVAQDFWSFSTRVNTGTAVTVHLAGAAFGFLYYKGNWRIMNWLPNLPNLRTWQRDRKARSRFRVYNEREERPRTPVPVGAPPAVADVDEQLEAKLDAVLQKVSQQGKESLTDSEKQILLRASEVFKKRRS
ncbi:MAG TPA: rhomboid family intramembrane serine protease [Gemmataceae bacterium]|jgi:membrane associated rhomboid family serine protease|nr:rhomboid family intramembrane serine protease [Gemmataceae bacterium]